MIINNNYNTCHTEINFLGLKFKFLNKKLIKRPDFSSVINKIKEKYHNNQKIKVGFLVNENSKWNAEILYNLLDENEHFEPVIILTLLTDVHNQKDITRNNLEKNYDFFKKTNKNIVIAYDENNHEYIDLRNFDIDILFYQQPWGIADIQNINNVSLYALCCYYPYGISVLNCTNIEVLPFHKKLFAYFVPNEEAFDEYSKLMRKNSNNMKIVGYPKLDIYNILKSKQTSQDKKNIIYAPHFSYSKNSCLKIGTFNWSGNKILEFAKAHQEYNWIFKPHPNLKNTLYADKKYGQEFADNYYSEWEKLGKNFEQGNYFELFINSDLLITDCASFLIEYMSSKKPIIRLENNHSTKLSKIGENVINGIYRVKNISKFENIFEQVIINGNDELLSKREEITNNIIFKNKNASVQIVNELLRVIA